MNGRQLCAGLGKQQKEPLVGSGIKGRRRAGRIKLLSAEPPTGGCWVLWSSVKTPEEGWAPSDDIRVSPVVGSLDISSKMTIIANLCQSAKSRSQSELARDC